MEPSGVTPTRADAPRAPTPSAPEEPGASPFLESIDALLGLLRLAARGDIESPGAGEGAARACERLAALAIPPDLRKHCRALVPRFGAASSDAALADVIRDVLPEIERWARPGFADALLERSLASLKGVGAKRAESLASRGLGTIADLLFHLPVRYDDRRSLARVEDLEVGRRATFMAEVQSADLSASRIGGRFRRILEAVVRDATGSVNLKWFRSGSSIQKQLEPGTWLLVTGDVKRYRFAKELVHPEIEVLDRSPGEAGGEEAGAGHDDVVASLRSVTPVYPVLEGIHSRSVRRLIGQAVADYSDLLEGRLPAHVVRERKLPDAASALRLVHEPELHADVAEYAAFRSAAHERLVLEELYLLELGLLLRQRIDGRRPGIAIEVASERVRAAPSALPFRLTGAQERVWSEIRADLARPHPMHRLLQGDVGSGKTAIALLAAAAVAADGRQAALMAPTELLAEQHARTLGRLARGAEKVLGLRLGLLTSSLTKPERDALLASLAAGELDLVIGTHALLQEEVAFRDLALAIIDEQHRFGVLQRAALGARAEQEPLPHVLVMTATPIPRTLALTVYGDLDVSVIDELPPGRTPIETILVRDGEGQRVMRAIRERLDLGEQVYVVYPLVEESERIDLRAAQESAERIARAFSDVQVDLVHGRLDREVRNRVMERFARGEIRILVSTTVIEVGVDVANATLMVVEHAERFGLAQLHQLRGRVGRGERPGACMLVARGGGRDARERLSAMLRTSDGFEIADADLRIRGPGEFLGTRQSGDVVDLRLADLVRDARLVAVAREAAAGALRRDPFLAGNARLAGAVRARWGEKLALADVG